MGTNTLEVQYDYYLKLAELYDTIDLTVPWDWKKQHNDSMPSSNAQRVGAIAESVFITECLQRDFEPHTPITPMPWDFIVTCSAGVLKVQVKSTSVRKANTFSVNTSSGCESKTRLSNDLDVVAIYISPKKVWYHIPRSELPGKTIKLNPEPESKSKYKKYQDNWSVYYA